VKTLSILTAYRVLRAHHQRTIFQAIRYALWLTRHIEREGASLLRNTDSGPQS
jgi:hypothetical protein